MNEELTTLNAQLQDKVQRAHGGQRRSRQPARQHRHRHRVPRPELRIKRFTHGASARAQSAAVRRRPAPEPHRDESGRGGSCREMRGGARSVDADRKGGGGAGRQAVLCSRAAVSHVRQEGSGSRADAGRRDGAEADRRELRRPGSGVSADLRRMTRLHELSSRLAGWGPPTRSGLDQIIRAATGDHRRRWGHHPACCDDAGVLTMAAHVGFDASFLDVFARADAVGRAAPRRPPAASVSSSTMSREPDLCRTARRCTCSARRRARRAIDATRRSHRVSFSACSRPTTGRPHHFDAAELALAGPSGPPCGGHHRSPACGRGARHTHTELEERVAERTKSLR